MPRPGVTFRPRLEPLEAREVPAVLRWTNALGTGLAGAAGNWQVLVGGSEESGTWSTSFQPPAQGDTLRFDGNVTTASCTGVYGFGLDDTWADYAAIRLVNGYTGTVTFASEVVPGGEGGGGSPLNLGIAVNTFEMEDGAINQQEAATQLFVLDSLVWSGGIMNNGGIPSVLTVAGSGEITVPTDGLSCGDTINFTNPTANAALMTIITGAGTLLLTGGDGINVEADAKVKVSASPGIENRIITVNGVKTLVLDPGSSWGYVGDGGAETNLLVVNFGGKFFLGDPEAARTQRVTLNLTAGDHSTPAYTQLQLPFLNFDPRLEIMSGCNLQALLSDGVAIHAGTVWLARNANLQAQDQTAAITGKFTMTGGTIAFQPPTQQDPVWGAFAVVGDVHWSGGTFNPGVDCREAGDSANVWHIVGTLNLYVSDTSKPSIIPVPQLVPQGQQTPKEVWTVVTFETVAGGNPIVPQGWKLDPVLDPDDGSKVGYRVEYVGS